MRATVSLTRTAIGVTLLLGSVVIVGGCDRRAPYRIGVVLDADGVRAASLAAEEVNAAGGVGGHPIELRNIGGGGSTRAKLALETAYSLASDKAILAVVGHTNSSASLAASQVYNARHIAQIAPTTTSPLYGDAGPYSFRLAASDVHQGMFLADQALRRTPRERVALVYVNDDYGRPLGKVVLAQLRAAGVEPVYDAPYAEEDTLPVKEIASALVQARPDLLIWIGRAYDYARLQPLLAPALPRLEVIASDGFGGPALLADSLHQFDGIKYVRLVDLERPDSLLRKLRALYVRDGFGEPSDQAILSYDAVRLFAEALRQVGPNREAIRDWLSHVGRDAPPFPGMSGPIAFPAGGSRVPQYFLRRIGSPRPAS